MLQSANEILNRISDAVNYATRTTELLVRWFLALSVVIILLFPTMIVATQWIYDVFNSTEPIQLSWALFEALVIAMIFLFGVALLFGLASGAPELQVLILAVAFALVMMATATLGEVSNRCLVDLECDGYKFAAGLGIVFAISLMSYILPALIRRTTPWFGIAYLAVSIWESELWLWQSFRNNGIEPTSDAVRGLFLLLFSIFWLGVFSASARRNRQNEL